MVVVVRMAICARNPMMSRLTPRVIMRGLLVVGPTLGCGSAWSSYRPTQRGAEMNAQRAACVSLLVCRAAGVDE